MLPEKLSDYEIVSRFLQSLGFEGTYGKTLDQVKTENQAWSRSVAGKCRAINLNPSTEGRLKRQGPDGLFHILLDLVGQTNPPDASPIQPLFYEDFMGTGLRFEARNGQLALMSLQDFYGSPLAELAGWSATADDFSRSLRLFEILSRPSFGRPIGFLASMQMVVVRHAARVACHSHGIQGAYLDVQLERALEADEARALVGVPGKLVAVPDESWFSGELQTLVRGLRYVGFKAKILVEHWPQSRAAHLRGGFAHCLVNLH